MGWPCCLTHCKSARPSLTLTSLSYTHTHLTVSGINKSTSVNFTMAHPVQYIGPCIFVVLKYKGRITDCSAGLGFSLTRCSFIRQHLLSATTYSFMRVCAAFVHHCLLPLCSCLWFPAAAYLRTVCGCVQACICILPTTDTSCNVQMQWTPWTVTFHRYGLFVGIIDAAV